MKTSISGSQVNTTIHNIKGILYLYVVPEVSVYLGWLFIINVRSNRTFVDLSIGLQRRSEVVLVIYEPDQLYQTSTQLKKINILIG